MKGGKCVNFLGKEIDDVTIGKIKKFMDTREGNILKQQLQNMSSSDLKKLLESARGTNLDENKLKAVLGKSPEEILKSVDINKLNREEGK